MKIGIIGGSGLEKLNIFENAQDIEITTQYGSPSSSILKGYIGQHEIFILSRHGRDHNITPTHVNNKANISVLNDLGCESIIATTATGSLREEIGIGDIVIPDQFIDFTKYRETTFFNTFANGDMKHTSMGDPFNEEIRNKIFSISQKLNIKTHNKGTIVTIEGPRFSTRAESKMFRIWGADIINMSIAPEAILANEIDIPYAVIAISTDYDSWIEGESPVTMEEVFKVFKTRVNDVTQLLIETILNM